MITIDTLIGPLAGARSNRKMTTLETIADYVLALRFESLSEETLTAVRNCVLDCVTAAVAGSSADGAVASRKAMESVDGKCSLWFSGNRAALPFAIFANSTAASILDLDDGHRAATGHPGAAIIPSCLVAAEEMGCPWEELIAAIVVGYEVAIRVAAGRDFSRLDTMSTGKWCNFGVAAALGRMQGLSKMQLVQAMAIAGLHGPNQSAAGYSRIMGNHVKEGIPWSSLTGAIAVTLARAGFTGPTDILDHAAYFERTAILRGLGGSSAIDLVYFKPYSCCRWAHAAIDALTDIIDHDGLRPDAVEKIEVHTFERALKLNNDPDPETLEAAQYSVPYMLGIAAHYGRAALLPFTEDRLHDLAAVNFAKRVELYVDPSLDVKFPETTAARVILKTSTGEHTREVIYPLGDPSNPMPRDKLLEKFNFATRGFQVEEVRRAIDCFDAGDYRPLLAALGSLKPRV